MEQSAKIECKNQSIIPLQLEDVYSQSQSIFHTTAKSAPSRLKGAKARYLLEFNKKNWAINLVKLNPFKKNDIIASIGALANIFNDVATKQPPVITNLNFNKICTNQQTYHIFLSHIDSTFYSIKIRDNNGYVVSFKIKDNASRVKDLSEIFKKMGEKMPIYIYDFTQHRSYIKDINSQNRAANLIFILNSPLGIPLTYSMKEQQGLIFYFHHKMKKTIPFNKIITQFASIDTHQRDKIRQLLTSYEQDLNEDTQSLVANVLMSNNDYGTSSILQILRKGLQTLSRHIGRWAQNNQHYPGAGSSGKKECFWCKRKKIEAICKGCTTIYRKQIRLCIKSCFQKHHEAHSMFIQTEKEQICKNITFFDSKCNQIKGLMQCLTEQQNPEFLQFLTYLRSRMVSSFNRLTAFGNEDLSQQKE